jgi:hypothetical protein
VSQRFGVNAQTMFWGMPTANWNAQVGVMARDGIQTVRADAAWASVQPTAEDASRGIYEWRYLDRIETALALQRIRWLPVADYSAPWDASSTSNGKPDPFSAPRDDEDFGRFAAALVARYGSRGSFWSANPQLPYVPITAVEIWNEENTAVFWHPAPEPAAYLQLYETARSAIHAVARQFEVLVGGVSNPAGAFLAQLYAAGGESRSLFDGVAIHPYALTPAALEQNVVLARTVLDQHGNFDTPLDVTEFGWPSLWTTTALGGAIGSLLGPPPSTTLPFISDATRAAYLSAVTDSLATSDCGIERIIPHTWVTSQQSRSSAEYWYGIVSMGGAQSQSAVAYSRMIALLERSPASTHAENVLCGRSLSLSVIPRAAHRARSSACVRAKVSSHGFPIDRAIVSFTSPGRRGAFKRRTVNAVTDRRGIAVGCVPAQPDASIRLSVEARRPDFANVPSRGVRARASR